MLKKIIVFVLFYFISLSCLADFEIREPCVSDADIENNKGVKLKFYASLLAYNSDKPRCILIKPVIASHQVEEAITHNDPISNNKIVDILLTADGKKRMAEFTRQNIGKSMAMIIDDKILTMATIQTPIDEGKIQIRGLWYEDAIRLINSVNQK